MSWLEVYLITRLDSIKLVITIISIVCFSIPLLKILMYCMFENNLSNFKGIFNKTVKGFIISGVALVVILSAIPSSKDMFLIKVIPAITNSKTINYLSDHSRKVIEKVISDFLDDKK